jgi:hypothetical protein
MRDTNNSFRRIDETTSPQEASGSSPRPRASRGGGRGRGGRGGAGRGGASTGRGGTVPVSGGGVPAVMEFLAALLPFQVWFAIVHLSSQMTPYQIIGDRSEAEYAFTLEDVEQLLVVLRANKLTCILSLSTVGEVWRIVNEQILSHLSTHGIIPPPASGSFPRGYFTTPMYLIHPKGGRQVLRRAFVQSDITSSAFTATTLERTSRLVSNPEDNARHPLLFFGASQPSPFLKGIILSCYFQLPDMATCEAPHLRAL